MITRFAIDIVILPPDHVMNVAIEWNQHLSQIHPQPITLSRTGCVPHISLLMGCLSVSQLPNAEAALNKVANSFDVIDVEISGVKIVGDTNTPVVALDITHSPTLASLHGKLVSAFTPMLTQDAKAADFNDASINPSSIEWTNNFITTQCGENYWPHLTVGHGMSEKEQKRYNFKATRIAIFHMGNHCTCKRSFFETSLRR